MVFGLDFGANGGGGANGGQGGGGGGGGGFSLGIGDGARGGREPLFNFDFSGRGGGDANGGGGGFGLNIGGGGDDDDDRWGINIGGGGGGGGDNGGGGGGGSIHIGGDGQDGGGVSIQGGGGSVASKAQGNVMVGSVMVGTTGYGVDLKPAPVVTDEASGSAVPNSSPQCAVQGGPATLLYFPPQGQQGSLDSANVGANGPPPPSPAGGQAYTTLGQTFQPGSAYISCKTLWAGCTDEKGSVTQTGPTFTNAMFPVPSDQISTQCRAAVDAKATAGGDAAAVDVGSQLDFGLAHDVPENCRQIAPPPGLLNMVPEWKDYAFWDMQFEQPEAIDQPGAPAPRGPVWTPAAESSCSIVQPATDLVPTTPVAMPGPSASGPDAMQTSTGMAGAPTTSSAPSHSPTAGRSSASASASSPAAYTGAASRTAFGSAGKSSLAVGALLLSLLVL